MSIPEKVDLDVDLVVIGSGPGGYTAAFRAADLGLKVALVEKYSNLGGVCLNVGCIPSKTLLHTAKIIDEADDLKRTGVKFEPPSIDIEQLRLWKTNVVSRLTGGLATLSKKRGVETVQGVARFLSDHRILIAQSDRNISLNFKHAIIATGSKPNRLANVPNDERIFDSTGALELKNVPNRLLIIGGGIIGLEMACIYSSLGSQVSVVEYLNQLMTDIDEDLVRPLTTRLKKRCSAIYLGTKVLGIQAKKECIHVDFEGSKAPISSDFDSVLIAIGRSPDLSGLDIEKAGITPCQNGFIAVDQQQRTNVRNIFAIGDVVGPPMLAHKATHEGKVAAEVITGHNTIFQPQAIPSVAYTDPEIAWVGLTEEAAKIEDIKYEKSVFPWAASGRALGMNRGEGLTKLLFDPKTNKLLGAGIVGINAGDLISEACLAIEMGCEADDISLTIHPHPTLSETIPLSAEVHQGVITDLYNSTKKDLAK